MICLISFLYWQATGGIIQCEDCPMRDECMEKEEELEENDDRD